MLLGLWTSMSVSLVGATQSCPTRPASEQDAIMLASEWFSLGDRYVREAKFRIGKEAFECSYSLVAHPASLLNAALAAQKVENTVDACRLFSQYLSVSNDEAKNEKVIEILDDLDCELLGDDVDVAIHTPLEGPPPDRIAAAQSSENVEIQSPLVPRLEVGIREDEVHARDVLRSSGFVVMGVGEAGLATGVVFQVLAGYAAHKQNQTEYLDDSNRYKSEYEKFQTAAAVAFVSGALVFVTGLTMYLISRKRYRNGKISKCSNPSVSIVFEGLNVQGSF